MISIRAVVSATLGVALLTTTAVAAPAAADTAADTGAITRAISFPDLAFQPGAVDVTGGPVTAVLRWTVTDPESTASQVTGMVDLRQYAGTRPVGPVVTVRYALGIDAPATVYADPGSTPARSTYSYELQVPQYGAGTHPTWRVTRIAAADDRGTAGARRGPGLAVLTVTGLDDTTAPTLMAMSNAGEQPAYVFDDGSGVTLRYFLEISDGYGGSGFWKGRAVLTGPHHVRLTQDFQLEYRDTGMYCGQQWTGDPTALSCDLEVKVPAGSPSGAWKVDHVQLTDRAGGSGRTDVPLDPIVVSRNDVLSASGFALDPAQFDNWRGNTFVTLRFTAAGVRGGLTQVVLPGGSCSQYDWVPAVGADGSYTIRLWLTVGTERCEVTGIALLDGAGHAAVYGAAYGGPALDLLATRIPDTTPPVALAASLPDRSAPADTVRSIAVDVTVDDTTLSPIQGYGMSVYAASGTTVASGGHPVQTGPDGVLHLTASVFGSPLPAGTYTIAFNLTDTAGHTAYYGYTGFGSPVPGGPLALTIA